MIRSFAITFLAACLPSVALAEMDVQNIGYTCARGVNIPVVYANSGETSIAVLVVEGRQILLHTEVTASGARYGWPSGGSNYVWLTKGSAATLMWRDGATNTETILLADCDQD